MREWSVIFKVFAVLALPAGALIFLAGSVVGVLLIPLAFSLWFMADVCTGLAEVFEYFAAANKARKTRNGK
jgi:hypothetical protein